MLNNRPEFYQTMMGRKFYEYDVPRIMKALERIALAMERQNELDAQTIEQDNRAHDLREQELRLHTEEFEEYKRSRECDCPECQARREAESQAKG